MNRKMKLYKIIKKDYSKPFFEVTKKEEERKTTKKVVEYSTKIN